MSPMAATCFKSRMPYFGDTMFKPWSCAFALMLAASLPPVASAAPVTVITHSVGTADYVDSAIMTALGAPGFPTGENTYELTLQSNFDLDVNEYTGDTTSMYVRGALITMTLTMGAFTVEKTGIGTTQLYLDAANENRYAQHALFREAFSNLYVSFVTWHNAAPGSVGGNVLEPRELTGEGAGSGGMGIDAIHTDPDVDIIFSMNGGANRSAVSVISSVPEPAEWAMLAAGAVVIAARRRRAMA
jgi:hypothetical protein